MYPKYPSLSKDSARHRRNIHQTREYIHEDSSSTDQPAVGVSVGVARSNNLSLRRIIASGHDHI
jgi:hypothetical protein